MKHSTLIKNAAAVVTCNSNDEILKNVDLLIEENRLSKIIPSGEATPEAQVVIDGRNLFVYPGMINTHHHFFQTLVRNNSWLDWTKLTVIEWLDVVYRIFKNTDGKAITASTQIAMADLIKHGCTTAFDHSYCHPAGTGGILIDRQVEAARAMGMRFIAGRGVNTLPRDQGSTIPDEMVETTDGFLKECERLIETYHSTDFGAMEQIVVAPCQPINSYKETFVESVKLARAKGVGLHTHLSEGEDPIMVERYGMRSLDWLEEMDFIGPDTWFAHCWDLSGEELDRLGQAGSGISHCPAPVYLGGFNPIDIPRIQAHKIPFSLGCDGSASNDNSNLADSLRSAYMLQSFVAKTREFPVPSPYDFLKYATAGGAQVLGRSDIGTLEEGKTADLFCIDISRLEYAGAIHDPASLPVKVGLSGPVDLTMINGKIVFQKGELQGMDEADIAAKANEICQRVIIDSPEYQEGRKRF